MNHKIFIIGQAAFLILFVVGIFIFYPRANVNVSGNIVNIKTSNANVIILSSNPDFSNPRYVDVKENVSFNLRPGTYYWKASNGVLESFSNKFKIESEVGLRILEKDGKEELKNVGNVKVNVTKTKEGGFVGHIILEPDNSEEIKDGGQYVGKQADQ